MPAQQFSGPGGGTASVSSKSKLLRPEWNRRLRRCCCRKIADHRGGKEIATAWAVGSAGSAGDEFAPARSAHVKVRSRGNGSDRTLESEHGEPSVGAVKGYPSVGAISYQWLIRFILRSCWLVAPVASCGRFPVELGNANPACGSYLFPRRASWGADFYGPWSLPIPGGKRARITSLYH
jgi:hypothetical protein